MHCQFKFLVCYNLSYQHVWHGLKLLFELIVIHCPFSILIPNLLLKLELYINVFQLSGTHFGLVGLVYGV